MPSSFTWYFRLTRFELDVGQTRLLCLRHPATVASCLIDTLQAGGVDLGAIGRDIERMIEAIEYILDNQSGPEGVPDFMRLCGDAYPRYRERWNDLVDGPIRLM